jgi:hypothetical protein
MEETRKCKALNLVYAQMCDNLHNTVEYLGKGNTMSYKIKPCGSVLYSQLRINFGDILIARGSISNDDVIIEHSPSNIVHTTILNTLLDKLGIPGGSSVTFRCLIGSKLTIDIKNNCTLRNNGINTPISPEMCYNIISECVYWYPGIKKITK